MVLSVQDKLAILSDAAKYDASCASSGAGSVKRDGSGLGSTGRSGICHSYTPDGRCVSLLKILFTNACIYDCSYCINRRSSNVRRARFSVEQVVSLTIDFYKRNYIEGLFLSSGIIVSPDHTMELLVAVARQLRVEHGFRGYIHLKTIPGAAQELLDEAARHADRLSINIELPTQTDLQALAPEKDQQPITDAMQHVADASSDRRDERRRQRRRGGTAPPHYAPAGQSTQMIIGATPSADRRILTTASGLYDTYALRRVYYSAYSPIPDASANLPLQAPPLVREHRLYQADWLLRFYGFSVDEIAPADQPMLHPTLDPKTAWAMRHRHLFPVDINTADKETLLRVPGLGPRSVGRILTARRGQQLALMHLQAMRCHVRTMQPWICTTDHHPGVELDRMQMPAIDPPSLNWWEQAPPAPTSITASQRSPLITEVAPRRQRPQHQQVRQAQQLELAL